MHRSLAFSFTLPFVSFLAACSPGAPSETGAEPSAAEVVAGGTGDGTPQAPAAPAAPAAPSPTAARPHRRCGWVFTNEPAGAAAFLKNADRFDALHPVWGALRPDDGVRLLVDADNPDIVGAARAHRVALVPTVASVDNTAWTRSMMRDAGRRAAHVRTLVELAAAHGWDGIDLDYEHLWDPADREPLLAFVKAYGAAMHAAGKIASMAVPATASASPVWSYPDLADALDHVHMMAYDFHYVGGPHVGPTAPLGWVDAVAAFAAAASPHPERFILGLPNYGVSAGAACDLADCARHCRAPAVADTAEMSACSENHDAFRTGRVLACDGDLGRLFFDDAGSIAEKVDAARAHHLGGVAYWKLGGEPAGFFEAIGRL